MALLFEAICEYPRNIDQYDNLLATIPNGKALNAAFLHNSNNNVQFARSIRSRNWMRYGVAWGLLAVDVSD